MITIKLYNFVFEVYEDMTDFYIDNDMVVYNRDDETINEQIEIHFFKDGERL